VRRWGALITGGVIIAVLVTWEHIAQRTASPRVFEIIVAGALLAACYKAWFEQKSRADHAEAARDARAPELRIDPDNGSRYVLNPVNNARHGDFSGVYLEFHLMIENTGRRDSTINNYKVEIVELEQTFPDLTPMEGQNGVQGRHCHVGMYPPNVLSATGFVRIQAENATNRGILLFFIPGVNLDQFANKGLHMHGPEHRFDPLHCRLTLTDTTRKSATCEFRLDEH
jgi:hypothetical protein